MFIFWSFIFLVGNPIGNWVDKTTTWKPGSFWKVMGIPGNNRAVGIFHAAATCYCVLMQVSKKVYVLFSLLRCVVASVPSRVDQRLSWTAIPHLLLCHLDFYGQSSPRASQHPLGWMCVAPSNDQCMKKSERIIWAIANRWKEVQSAWRGLSVAMMAKLVGHKLQEKTLHLTSGAIAHIILSVTLLLDWSWFGATHTTQQETRINEHPMGNRKDFETWWLTPASDQWSPSNHTSTRNKNHACRIIFHYMQYNYFTTMLQFLKAAMPQLTIPAFVAECCKPHPLALSIGSQSMKVVVARWRKQNRQPSDETLPVGRQKNRVPSSLTFAISNAPSMATCPLPTTYFATSSHVAKST